MGKGDTSIMSKLHDCKRGLAIATPADYNRWWRRVEELEGVVLSYEIEAAIDLNRIEELEEELEYVEARLKEVPEQNT